MRIILNHPFNWPYRAMVILASGVLSVAGLGSSASAQSVPDKYKFSMPAQAVIQRLESIQALPATEWRYHLGDIAHGERSDINDSDWQTVKPSA